MVPNSWEITNFGQLVEFRNGLNFTKADQGETIKIVGVADFKDHSSLSSLDNLNTINVGNTVKDNDLIKSGDVLYVRSNGNKDLIGRCLFFPEVTEKLSFSGFTIRGRVTSKAILPNYLALLSRSEIVKQQFSKNGGGTNISNLSQQILNDVVVPLPTIEEQRKIAKILSTWDKAIATTEKLIETSKQQKEALMQQLLTGKKRLVNPETGKAFEGEWEEAKLEAHINLLSGHAFKSSAFEKNSDYKLLRGINITCGTLRWTEEQTFSWTNLNGFEKYLLNVGDIVISMDGSLVGRNYALITENNHEPMLLVQRVARIRCKSTLDHNYLLQHIASDRFKSYVDAVKTVTAIPHISAKDIKHFMVPLASVEEQQKIAFVLTTADKEIELLEDKLAHFKQEKKALMQQLLTGKRRVTLE